MAGFPRAGHNYVYELYVKFGLIFRLLNVANNFLNQAKRQPSAGVCLVS